MLASLLIAVSSVAFAGPFVATQTSSSEFTANSTEGRQIQDFIATHRPALRGQQLDISATKGIFKVKFTTTSDSATVQIPGPPMPLPGMANEGDQMHIEHISGGVTQNWSYTYSSGQWNIVHYSITYNPR